MYLRILEQVGPDINGRRWVVCLFSVIWNWRPHTTVGEHELLLYISSSCGDGYCQCLCFRTIKQMLSIKRTHCNNQSQAPFLQCDNMLHSLTILELKDNNHRTNYMVILLIWDTYGSPAFSVSDFLQIGLHNTVFGRIGKQFWLVDW